MTPNAPRPESLPTLPQRLRWLRDAIKPIKALDTFLPTIEDALAALEVTEALPENIESRLRWLERFSDDGQHKRIPGPSAGEAWEIAQDLRNALAALEARPAQAGVLTFAAFRRANAARCVKWHPEGIASWSSSDWLTAVTGELGELASLLKMRNRERDGLPGNKFSPTDKMIADELADVLTYLDLLAEVLGVDLGAAAVSKFNEVSERVGFPDRIELAPTPPTASGSEGVAWQQVAESLDQCANAPGQHPQAAHAYTVAADAVRKNIRLTTKPGRVDEADSRRLDRIERDRLHVVPNPIGGWDICAENRVQSRTFNGGLRTAIDATPALATPSPRKEGQDG
jgi:NTP pyrophosphatase (non-canonical NTP hydrolase)